MPRPRRSRPDVLVVASGVVAAIGVGIGAWLSNRQDRPASDTADHPVPAPAVPAPAAPAANDQVSRASKDLRDTTKWFIGAFAAVGALLLGGLSISKLGSVETTHDLRLAALGAALGITGVIVAIYAASNVLTPKEILLDDLTEGSAVGQMVASDPTYLRGYTEALPTLKERYVRELREYRAAQTAYLLAPDDPVLKAEAERREGIYRPLQDVIFALRRHALVQAIQAAYSRATVGMLAGVVISAVGLVLFSYYANRPAPKPSKPTAPTVVRVALTPGGAKTLDEVLGAGCDTDSLRGVVLSGDLKQPDIVTIPENGCESVRVTLDAGLGRAIP